MSFRWFRSDKIFLSAKNIRVWRIWIKIWDAQDGMVLDVKNQQSICMSFGSGEIPLQLVVTIQVLALEYPTGNWFPTSQFCPILMSQFFHRFPGLKIQKSSLFHSSPFWLSVTHHCSTADYTIDINRPSLSKVFMFADYLHPMKMVPYGHFPSFFL